jgi:hypothetical protein
MVVFHSCHRGAYVYHMYMQGFHCIHPASAAINSHLDDLRLECPPFFACNLVYLLSTLVNRTLDNINTVALGGLL